MLLLLVYIWINQIYAACMNTQSTSPVLGLYQYSYPTFVDTPQRICVHFFTPDKQKAFVSYPQHPNHKAAQLIPVSWFRSVVMVRLDGQPRLMECLETILTGWFNTNCFYFQPDSLSSDELDEFGFNTRFAA